MVTTVHLGDESIVRRRRPRLNKTNKNHVREVWGDDSVKEVAIPSLIDDYNHWMLGVDKSDQLVAYYRPNLRCRRTWMPIMFHYMDIMRVNSFVIYNKLNPNDMMKHKNFIMSLVEALLGRASGLQYCNTRLSKGKSPLRSTNKRLRMSSMAPSLPGSRLKGDRSLHIETFLAGKKQGSCRYCAYEAALRRRDGKDSPAPVRTTKICLACGVHLCSQHFDVYHTPPIVASNLVEV